MKKIVTSSLTTLGLFAAVGIGSAKDNSRVNFILIHLDDMGYGDLSLTGASSYSTPNIDKLGQNGIFFTHYYSAQAVSSASRAGLLTGCYPNRIGFAGALNPRSDHGIGDQEETIAQVLKKVGYATSVFGKWHVGSKYEYLPLQKGFDEFYGIPYSHDMWPNHPTAKNYYPPLPLYDGNEVVETMPDINQFTQLFTKKSVEFIEKNKKNPFFLYLAHPLPHVPLAVSEKFRGKSEQGLYGDVMMDIDNSVMQIMQTLKKLKLEEKTIVIFTSDNGPWLNYGNHAGSSGGLREGKGTTFEGGQRVPCLIYWKGVTPNGAVCNKMIAGMDFLPTFASLAKAALPKNKIDGVDISELIKGNFDTTPRKTLYYYYKKNSLEAVSNGSWKLVFPHSGRSYYEYEAGKDGIPGRVQGNKQFEKELFDLRRDPGEQYNVLNQHPEMVEILEKIAQEAREDLGDDLTGYTGKNRRLE
ncbi:MAG: sulfatase [Pigmentiphaga sp.]|nr:sulfatase [Pigmentiphaga sp.]